MNIDELILTAFGKFDRKVISLEKGFNIIYGDNEAGKTTIHKFIEGLFYGFFKPYTKRKVYSEDYDKYFPWGQNDFRGVLKYNNDGTKYRIERSFVKGNDDLKIYDDKTGEDISYLFEYDSVTRLHQPSSLHLGFNNVVYNNTINIRQLGSKTEGDLAKEIKDSLINLGGSLDEDISVKKVIEKINKNMDEIGTKGRIKTSPYGKVVEEIEELKKEKSKSITILSEAKKYQENLNELIKNLEGFKAQKSEIENLMEVINTLKDKERYDEAVGLLNEIKKLEIDIENLKEYDKVEPLDFTEAIKLENSIKTYEESLESLNTKLSKLNSRLKRLTNSLNILTQFDVIKNEGEIDELSTRYVLLQNKKQELNSLYEKIKELSVKVKDGNKQGLLTIKEDLFEFEKKEDEKNSLLYNRDSSKLIFLKNRVEEKQSTLKTFSLLMIFSIIISAITIYLGFFIDPLLYTVIALPIGGIIYSNVSIRGIKNYIKKTDNQITQINEEEKIREENISKLQGQMDDILKKHNCQSKLEMRKRFEDFSREAILAKDNILAIEGLKLRKNELIEEIQNQEDIIKKYLVLIDSDYDITEENVKKVKAEYHKYIELKKEIFQLNEETKETNTEKTDVDKKINDSKERVNTIFKKNMVNSLDEFSIALEKKKKYDNAIQMVENKRNLLSKVLGDNSIDYLRKKIESHDDLKVENIQIDSVDRLEKDFSETNNKIIKTREDITRLEEKINNFLSNAKPLVDIEEEIVRKQKIKKELEDKLIALELAKSTIDKLSKDIQKDFAPKLNNVVSDIISKVTNDKYNEVKITEDINIKVNDLLTGHFVDIENLSGGTVDQLYFATRFGIMDILHSDNAVPLILDDCFIQYDENRLKKVLEFLDKESFNRQIILFTCHNREKEILAKLKVKYNYVEI